MGCIFSVSQDNKIDKLFGIKIDCCDDEIEFYDEKFLNSKLRKADKNAVMKYITKLLEHGEKEQGDVQKTLETEFNSSAKTIRNRIKEILSEHVVVKDQNNNSVVIIKKTIKQKHILFLKNIDNAV